MKWIDPLVKVVTGLVLTAFLVMPGALAEHESVWTISLVLVVVAPIVVGVVFLLTAWDRPWGR